MTGRRAVIGEDHVFPFAHTPKFDEALTVLRGLNRIFRIELARGPGKLAHSVRDILKRFCLVEAARDNQPCVIGLVKLFIKLSEPLHRNLLNIILRADC